MGTESRTLDYWRGYFRGADSGIFDAIENAILIAALDCPIEFRKRRDRIAELLFSCRPTKCLGCDRAELHVSDAQMVSNYSYDEAEALTEEMEEESQIVGEVSRIREVLYNRKDQSDAVLFESLRRLQLMRLSVETLQATEVGKAVNGLRSHGSKQIGSLARALVDEWKALVQEWIDSAAVLTETTPESADPASFEMDNGLPAPPLDGAFLATQTNSIELSKFFDGMDDDGNPRNIGEFDNIDGKERMLESRNVKSQKPSRYSSELLEDEDPIIEQAAIIRTHEAINKHSKSQGLENQCIRTQEALDRTFKMKASSQKQPKANENAPDSGPGRNPKPCYNHQNIGDTNPRVRSRSDVHKKPTIASQNYSEENLNQAKLEIAKRKLREGYQQAQNAKKQRTIQVMDLTDLPKQPVIHKPHHPKPGNRAKNWTNVRG